MRRITPLLPVGISGVSPLQAGLLRLSEVKSSTDTWTAPARVGFQFRGRRESTSFFRPLAARSGRRTRAAWVFFERREPMQELGMGAENPRFEIGLVGRRHSSPLRRAVNRVMGEMPGLPDFQRAMDEASRSASRDCAAAAHHRDHLFDGDPPGGLPGSSRSRGGFRSRRESRIPPVPA